MALKGEAFAPGHITGFFVIRDEFEDIEKVGSQGAGLCLDMGATTRVEISDGSRVTVWLNGRKSEAPVTRAVIKLLGVKYDIIVRTTLELPMGQGLGMSGAGALSTALAISSALDLDEAKAVRAAHAAEVKCKTGLGDVGPMTFGGMTIRERPGLLPYGRIKRIPLDQEVVLAIVGGRRSTGRVLRDPRKRALVNQHGKRALAALLSDPRPVKLIRLSREFAVNTGLAGKNALKAIKAVKRPGSASVSMIGNCVFAIGNGRVLKKSLGRYGDIMTCRIDNKGARVL
jgi:pantoate kinase